MRWSVAALLVLFIPAPTWAQADAPLLEDPASDVEVSIQGTGLPANPWTTLDLRALAWEEGPDDFTITLTVEDLEAPREQAFIVDGIDYYVRFEYGHQYQVNLWRSPLADNVFYGANLGQWDPATGRYAFIMGLEVLVDEAAGAISTTFPKTPIQDADGKTPSLGDTLAGIHVVSQATGATVASAFAEPVEFTASDRMPDQGAARWDVEYGIEQSGQIRLESLRPTRASNGEATTFIYEVTARNLAEAADTVRLQHGTLPQNWVVTFPQERVRLEAGQSIGVPVLITVPFAHSHGSYQSVLVEGQSQTDPQSVGRIELGVRYTAVPQPAGHHDTLWLHNSASGLYMNTLEDHEGDSGEPNKATSEGGNLATTTYTWHVPLLPPLQMGLDFDVAGQGSLDVTIGLPAGGVETTVHGTLNLQRGAADFFGSGDDTVLATFESASADMVPGEVRTFSMNVTPTADADRVPLEEGANLVLVLRVTTTAAFGTSLTPAGPSIHPGTSMRLPLNEFHDEVSGYFSTLSGIDMWAPDGQERLVNPGEAAVFRVEAENLGDEKATFDLRLTGTHAEWAEILGAERIQLPGGQTTTIHIAIVVPDDASDGERADVTLHAENTDDPNIRSLVRFLVEADMDDDHEDQSATILDLRGTPTKESPMPWLVVLIGLVLASRRR